MTKTPFKVGDRVVFNWKKWDSNHKGSPSRARYELTIKSIPQGGHVFKGEGLVNRGKTNVGLSGSFITKYFTLVKKQKRDSKGRFLGAKPAKATPFTPDSIVAGAKYTNSKYPDFEYFGVVLAGAKEMLLKTDGERFTVCFKGEHCGGNFWESFSEKVEK